MKSETPQRHILIADDDRDLALSLSQLLFLEGYHVRQASNPDETIGLMREQPAQVALLDIRLGRSDGIELLATLKKNYPEILCVMMTGYASTNTAVSALREGAYSYLLKPFEIEELTATLERCYQQINLQQEKQAAQEAMFALNQALEDRVRERTLELETIQRELLRKAHLAGMAETSASVLHNVGNVLTSLNTSSRLIQQKLSSTAKLNVISLINERLQGILQDPTKSELASVISLTQNFERLLCKEHKDLKYHGDRIQEMVKSVENVIHSHQRYAHLGEDNEQVNLEEIVEDGLAIQKLNLQENNIEVVRQFEKVPPIRGQKIKILHVLLNLIQNACEAMAGPGRLTLYLKEEKGIVLRISDTGPGLAGACPVRIFHPGYSTKGESRGYGLHHSANAMTNMGGSISAEENASGTTFVLRFLSA